MGEFLALSAPWFLLILSVVVIVILFFKKWKLAGCIVVLAIIGNWYFYCVPFNIFQWDNDTGQTLKVLSFNCNLSATDSSYYDRLPEVVNMIEQEDADVVFMTENFYTNFDTLGRSIKPKYPYQSMAKNSVGNCIYSKYSLQIDTALVDKAHPYGINCCKISYKGMPINILGCHLSSNNYNEHHKYMTPDSVENSQESRAYLRNVMDASRYREDEARELVSMLTEIPTIVMGDMNDVAGSPAMRVLAKAHFKDAWWEKGFGYGATIHKPLPYRIDHVLYREGKECRESRALRQAQEPCKERETVVKNGLRLKSIKKIDSNDLSDHDALVAEFGIR